jgi:di/tricarboxylate transporter
MRIKIIKIYITFLTMAFTAQILVAQNVHERKAIQLLAACRTFPKPEA